MTVVRSMAMPKPPMTQPITVRLDKRRQQRIYNIKERYPIVYPERMTSKLTGNPHQYTRSTVILMILDRGIDVLEAELKNGGWTGDE